MKYVKMLALAAVAATALMALAGAGTASATVLCHSAATPCPQKWPLGTETEFIVKPGTTAKWFSGANTLMTCTGGQLKAKITNAGSSTETVKTSVAASGFSWSSCNVTQETLEGGELETHSIAETTNGTMTMKGFAFKMNTTQYGTCIYTAGPTSVELGTLTASKTGEATIDIIAKLTKKEGSSFLCPTTIEWWEEWTQTKPSGTALYVEPS
jgi:opacity protein-like surface antigen